jgi:hypothetical protein
MMGQQVGELSYLRAAIRASRKVGLFAEFSDGYRMYREDGDGVEVAAWRSLYDWDILDDIVVLDDGSVALGLKMGGRVKKV